MTTIQTQDEKTRALKERMEEQRKLGATIDQLVRQADAEPSGCGICHIWRRLSGQQRRTAIAAIAASGAATATSSATGSVTTHSRLFGTSKSNPHSKLADAAASMQSRIQELECRAASERAEAKRLMGLGSKSSAMRALKRAKATEKQLEANQASLLAVEQQVDLMAQAQMQKQIASALASSSKGMKAQKKLLKTAETAVDDAAEARDMADDLGQVMADFASNGNNDDEDELMEELQQMLDEPSPAGAEQSLQDISHEEAKKLEIERLESRIARWDEAEEARRALPDVPTEQAARGKGKAKMNVEKARLLPST